MCDFFKLLRQKSTQTLRHFSILFYFLRQFLSAPLYRGYRNSSDSAPAGRALEGHGSHHRGPSGLLLGH